LLRAIYPLEGLELIAKRRPGLPAEQWCNGPAKLCRALAIDGKQNGINLCDPRDGLWIEYGEQIGDDRVTTGPRVGIQNVPEPWRSMPWRFLAKLE
jgi:DNA-3-methyladenine glycosylase